MISAAMLEGQEYSDFPARVASQLDSKMLLHQLADIVAARPVDELQISESRPPGHIPFGVLPYLERYTDKDNLGKDLLSLGGKIGDLGGSLMDKTGVARLSRMTGIDALAEKAKEAAKAWLDATKAGLHDSLSFITIYGRITIDCGLTLPKQASRRGLPCQGLPKMMRHLSLTLSSPDQLCSRRRLTSL